MKRISMKNKITVRIESGYGDLRRSEKRAADYILQHMEDMAELPLDRLARVAEVSQPTVLRMLKSLGYEGYRDFRYQLAAELAKRESGEEERPESGLMYGYILNRKEGLDGVPLNVTVTTERMLEETLKNFPLKTYRKVIEVLRNARLIDIYSVENSEVVTLDLMTKLLYLGLPCRHFSDCYLQQITAAGLTKEDVAIGISYSGESRDTVDALKAAKRAGACTIAITNFSGSLICKYADILICTSQDQHFYGNAIFSRSTQMLIVDMIYMGLISSDYDRCVEQLNKCERVVRRKAYEKN